MTINVQQWADFDALIFDMDGTLVDSGQVHEQAWSQALTKHNIPIDAALMRSLAGVPTIQTVDRLKQHFALNPNLDSRTVALDKSRFAAELAPTLLKETALANLVRHWAGKKKIALGTGAESSEAENILEQLGLRKFFPVVVGGDKVSGHKPEPDTFLLCAEELGVKPEQCVVFEDSVLGLAAGRAANMTVVDVADHGIYNDYFLEKTLCK
ncbi:HAD family hydrolase [Agaribacterium haliotis]|uniref:HAD family hydrolase n=1 Tax=Agaribacterium haliotis TaxID=2013869 RepID=UPI000BB565A7|nr:beta-phosphoglucomutase family hydrolase [Agaribacterium haliotis]